MFHYSDKTFTFTDV